MFSVCLLGVLVLMILQRLLNYGSTFMIGLIVTKILLAIGIIGVVGGLVMLGMERTGRRNGSRRIICGRNLLIASADSQKVLFKHCLLVNLYLKRR